MKFYPSKLSSIHSGDTLVLFEKSAKMTSANLFWCLTALCAITFIDLTEPLNILGLFPHPGISHSHFFRPIMRALAEKGHDVTVVSHFPDSAPHQNYKDLPLTKTQPLTNTGNLSVSSRITQQSSFIN